MYRNPFPEQYDRIPVFKQQHTPALSSACTFMMITVKLDKILNPLPQRIILERTEYSSFHKARVSS